MRGLKGKGKKYEGQVLASLDRRYPGCLIPLPWIRFWEGRQERWAQPDGLLVFPEGRVHIVEVKLRHTPQAWFQLVEVYSPLIRTLFPEELWEIRLNEVVRWYDPMVVFPGKCVLRPSLEEAGPNEVGVTIWTRDP